MGHCGRRLAAAQGSTAPPRPAQAREQGLRQRSRAPEATAKSFVAAEGKSKPDTHRPVNREAEWGARVLARRRRS